MRLVAGITDARINISNTYTRRLARIIGRSRLAPIKESQLIYDLKSACQMAAATLTLQERNKVRLLRSRLIQVSKLADSLARKCHSACLSESTRQHVTAKSERLRALIEALPPGAANLGASSAAAVVVAEVHAALQVTGKVDAIYARQLTRIAKSLSIASDNAATLPDGKQRYFHRDILARDIVVAMCKAGLKVTLGRDDIYQDPSRVGNTDVTYARLLRVAIEIAEGKKAPNDIFAHQKRGYDMAGAHAPAMRGGSGSALADP